MSTGDPLHQHHVRLMGPPDARRTLVFSHGFGTDSSAWAALAQAFEPDSRVVLFDHAGAGQSRPEIFVPQRYATLNGYVQDLVAICDALALRDAVLVGHSMGAMVGVLAAIRRPELFSRLVLISASPRYQNDGDYIGGFSPEDLALVFRAIVRNYARWVEDFAPRVVGPGHAPHYTEAVAATLKAIPPDKALTVASSVFQSDYRSVLGQLDKPTLLIQSSDDFAVPRSVAEYLHRHIRASRLEVIDASGHLPHVTQPDAVLAAMRGFV